MNETEIPGLSGDSRKSSRNIRRFDYKRLNEGKVSSKITDYNSAALLLQYEIADDMQPVSDTEDPEEEMCQTTQEMANLNKERVAENIPRTAQNETRTWTTET